MWDLDLHGEIKLVVIRLRHLKEFSRKRPDLFSGIGQLADELERSERIDVSQLAGQQEAQREKRGEAQRRLVGFGGAMEPDFAPRLTQRSQRRVNERHRRRRKHRAREKLRLGLTVGELLAQSRERFRADLR